MPKLAVGELSRHPTQGYRLSCGWYLKDGRKTPKVFWLGKDKDRATIEAQKIRWAAPIAAAMGGWTDEYVRQIRAVDTIAMVQQSFWQAERLRQQLAPSMPPDVIVRLPSSDSPETATAAAGSGTSAMLHAALDAYLAAVRQQPGSCSYKEGIRDSLEAVKHYRPDCPLVHVDYAWLEDLTNHIKKRPLSRNHSRASRQREPIKPHTVKRLLQHTRQAVKWIHRQRSSNQFEGWKAPEDWTDLFTVELSQIMTKIERDKAADGPEQLTINEIKQLYQAACDGNSTLHPILFLLGLFSAQGQSELACIRRNEIDLNSATFTHRRNKTGQKGIYWLPPKLVILLKQYFKKHPASGEDLAFRTRDGEPLVTPKSDAVRQAWDDWRSRAGINRSGFGFYSLRRFFGDYATRRGGNAAGDAALAHTPKSVRGKHYSNYRDFDGIRKIGKQLHAELKAAGMFR